MRINITENWNVKSKKDKSRENINIPFAYASDGSKKRVKFTKQFKINVKKGEEALAKNRRYVLEFEGIASNATIELNGRQLGEHSGGFLPFAVDITAAIVFNEKNRLVVYLDNTPNNDVLGLAKSSENLYEDYVGIIRDVYLNIIEKECFTNIYNETECHDNCFVYTTMEKVDGKYVHYMCAKCQINFIETPNDMYVVATLADSGKNVISRTKFKYDAETFENGFMIKVPVEDAILWSPEFPYLYYLKLELFAVDALHGEPELVDQRIFKRGFREFSVKDNNFYINGKKTEIKGICHHQVYPFIGMATSRRAEYREVLKLKNAGFNAIRLVNYPASKEFYEACDTLGMLVINCVPNNGKFVNTDAFKSNVKNVYSELAYRDRNHTSVCMWEMTIGDFTSKDGLTDDLIKECMELVKTAYPEGAKPLFIGDTNYRDAESVPELGLDIAYCNYDNKKNVFTSVPGVPASLIGSYGAEGYKADKKDKKVPQELKMAEQAWAYQFVINQNASVQGTIGAIVSQDIDYFNGQDKVVMGLMTEYRLPKTAYYLFQSQIKDAKPMVYMPHPKLAKLVQNMQVYTNCDTIKVYVDDQLMETYSVQKGLTTPYYDAENDTTSKQSYAEFIKQNINVGNNENLQHPPISLGESLKDVGNKVVRVDALNEGQIVRSMTVDNYEAGRYNLRIFVDYSGIALNNNERDFVFVHVALIDDNGNIISRDGERITLSIKGGDIINYSESKAVGGVSSYIVRAFEGTDKVLLKAVSKNKGEIKETYAKIIVKP